MEHDQVAPDVLLKLILHLLGELRPVLDDEIVQHRRAKHSGVVGFRFANEPDSKAPAVVLASEIVDDLLDLLLALVGRARIEELVHQLLWIGEVSS